MNPKVLSPEDASRLWEQEAQEIARMREPYERAEREKARLKAEQEAIEAQRKVELFVKKGTLAYSDQLALEICERVGSGEFLTLICSDAHMPTMRNATQWLRSHSDFGAAYRQAIDDRLNIFEDEVVTIADDVKADFRVVVRNGKEKRVHDPEVIARAKLRIDARFKHLKAYRPQKWGEQSTLNVHNKDDSFDPASMTAEELEKTIADIEAKNKVVRAA